MNEIWCGDEANQVELSDTVSGEISIIKENNSCFTEYIKSPLTLACAWTLMNQTSNDDR